MNTEKKNLQNSKLGHPVNNKEKKNYKIKIKIKNQIKSKKEEKKLKKY